MKIETIINMEHNIPNYLRVIIPVDEMDKKNQSEVGKYKRHLK